MYTGANFKTAQSFDTCLGDIVVELPDDLYSLYRFTGKFIEEEHPGYPDHAEFSRLKASYKKLDSMNLGGYYFYAAHRLQISLIQHYINQQVIYFGHDPQYLVNFIHRCDVRVNNKSIFHGSVLILLNTDNALIGQSMKTPPIFTAENINVRRKKPLVGLGLYDRYKN